MDARRLRAGEWLSGAAGAALLVSLFLPWYGDGRRGSLTAWQALGALDLLLALLALAALAVPVVTAAYRVPAVPIAHQSLLALAAVIVALLVIFRVLSVPGGASGREWGVWLGIGAVLATAAGALLAIRDERRSPAGRHTDLAGVPVAAPREIETLPAPRPEVGP